MQSSIVYEMPACEYHNHDAMSQSVLKKIGKSPKYLKWYMENGEPDQPYFAVGRAFHTLVLEPEKYEDTVRVFRETKTRNSKAFDAFMVDHAGFDVLLPHEADMINRMAESFSSNPLTKSLMSLEKEFCEVSLFWNDPVTGIDCKARPDARLDAIFDIKTSSDASYSSFCRSAKLYGYDRQAAWYLEGAKRCGIDVDNFVFVVCEKEPPFDIQLFYLDPEDIERGRKENARDLALYAECVRTGNWPGYSETIQMLSIGG